MRYVLTFFLLATSIVGQELSIECGWRGLSVFQTKREEVEKILGKPKTDDGVTRYENDEARVRIIFSALPCSRVEYGRGEYQLETNTIIEYQVNLKTPIELSDLKWKKDRYERIEDLHILDVFHYRNLKDGISFSTKIGNDNIERAGTFSYSSTNVQNERFRCREK